MLRKHYISLSSLSFKILKRYKGQCTPKVECAPCEIPRYETKFSVMPNGMRIATEETGSTIASFGLFIEAGPRFETAYNNGITHFIEHHAYKGFKDMTRLAFEEYVTGLGAKFYARTDRDLLSFVVTTTSDKSCEIFDIFAKILWNLQVTDFNARDEIKNVGVELLECERDAKKVTFDYLHATAFQGTPLSRRVIGPSRNVCRFNNEMASEYISDQFQPWRVVLATSGGVCHTELCGQICEIFKDFQNTSETPQEYTPARYSGSQVIYRDDSMPFSHVAIAVEAPSRASDSYHAMKVASHIVGSWSKSRGGGINISTKLGRAVAIENLSQSYESFYLTYRDVGLWGIYFIGNKMGLDDMLYSVQDTWMSLAISATSSDIIRGINNYKMELARRRSGSHKSVFEMATQAMYTCNVENIYDTFQRVSVVHPDLIRNLLFTYIYDQCPAVAAVGPVESLPDYTRIRAGMYWLRL